MKYVLLLTAFLTYALALSNENRAEEILSRYLAISNAEEFNNKMHSFFEQANSLALKPITPENKQKAEELYRHFSAFMELYAKKYSYPRPSSGLKTFSAFKSLAQRFSLTFSLDLVSIEDIFGANADWWWPSKANLLNFALSDPDRPLTQTEAYLSKPQLQDNLFNTESRFYPLIAEAIHQERLLRNYDVLYHGQSNVFMLFYDIVAAIYHEAAQEKLQAPFEYLRIPGTPQFEQKLVDFLDKGFDTDHEAAIKDVLLSVNFSLLGNSSRPGESSLNYFIDNASQNPPAHGITSLLTYLFKSLNMHVTDSNKARLELLYQKYLDVPETMYPHSKHLQIKTTKLLGSTHLPPVTGSMLQIFIPKEKINDYVYLSGPFGKPLVKGLSPLWKPINVVTAEGKTRTYDLKKIDTRTYISLYRSNPESIDYLTMDQIQGRVLLTNDFLLNPKSDIKIYRYTMIPPTRLKKYKRELQAIVKEIVAQHKAETSYTGSFIRLVHTILSPFVS